MTWAKTGCSFSAKAGAMTMSAPTNRQRRFILVSRPVTVASCAGHL
jgi:hypothetical protein